MGVVAFTSGQAVEGVGFEEKIHRWVDGRGTNNEENDWETPDFFLSEKRKVIQITD